MGTILEVLAKEGLGPFVDLCETVNFFEKQSILLVLPVINEKNIYLLTQKSSY